MKVCIYGAGSLGTVLGAYVAKSGEEIDLVNRNKAHVAALKENGATITGTANFNVKVNAMLPGEMKEKYDIIFLMTKQLNNKEVVKMLTNFLADDGVICTMQNGLPEHSVSEIIGEDRTYGCAIGWGAANSRRNPTLWFSRSARSIKKRRKTSISRKSSVYCPLWVRLRLKTIS